PLTSPLTSQNLERIHEDMSPSQVKAILGEPQEATSAPIPIVGGTVTTYHYRNDAGSTITIVFKNGLMKQKDGSFNNK
ncbi:MAG TPA: hypothetical protein VK970_24270, partial [Candidatus Methylacidiphilales bacterium]|nr:hypothetical protein [Candidatus Methylacidiphilales bacterium]